jgi:hypothetical protein
MAGIRSTEVVLRDRPRFLSLALALLAPLAATACGNAAQALGAGPAEARSHAGDLLTALAARFGPTDRDPAFEALRPKLARHALVPSGVFEDPTAWTSSHAEVREVAFSGRRDGGRYHVAVEAKPPEPAALADYRGDWRLERLRAGEFEWMAHEELAVGGVSPADLSRAATALFQSLEAAPAGDAAPRARRELPRTAAALGRLLTLEALSLAKDEDDATSVRLVASMHTETLRGEAPLYSKYLDDVIVPSRFAAAAMDETGARWWEVDARDARLAVRLRVHGGDLAPLDGPPRKIPGQLRVRTALSSRTGIFRTGVHDLDADTELVRLPAEKGFVARFRRSPEWDLPFLVPLLLRPSLRRPFEGDGAALSFSAQEGRDGPTLLTRHYRVAVRESWILRWVGGFAASAVNEFRRGEAEADRFSAQALIAVRDDLVALIDGSRR